MPPSSLTTSARPSPCSVPTSSFATARSRGSPRSRRDAPEQALVHFERALAAKGDAPTDDQAAEVLFGLGRAQLATLGHDQLRARGRRACCRSFDHYVEAGDIRRAIAVASHPLPLSFRFGYTDAAELIARALTLAAPGSHEAGRMLAQQGGFSGFIDGDYDRAQREFRAGPVDRRARGRLDHRAENARQCGLRRRFHLRWHDCLRDGPRAIELAVEDGDPSTEITARRARRPRIDGHGRARAGAFIPRPGARACRAAPRALVAHVDELQQRGSVPLRGRLVDRARDARPRPGRGSARPSPSCASVPCSSTTLGDDDVGAAYLARLQDVAAGVTAAGADRRPCLRSPSRPRSPGAS